MLYLIPLERYASIPFCGPYFLVGRNLRTKYDPLYETDQSTNSKIPVKAWMTRESISRTRMTSSSVLFSIAMKHFLPRLGKNALTRSPFIGDKTGFILQKQTLAALQFALTRDFKYLITSDDDFLLKMDVISKIDDNWFNLGILSAVQRLQVKVDRWPKWMNKTGRSKPVDEPEIFVTRSTHFDINAKSVQLNYCPLSSLLTRRFFFRKWIWDRLFLISLV